MAARDPFEVIGLKRGASDFEVQEAYRAWIRRPDHDDATVAAAQRSAAMQTAFATLMDPDSRRR